MKKFYYLLAFFLLTGCFANLKPSKITNKNQSAIENLENKLNKTDDSIFRNVEERERQTSIYATGVSYSLSQIENPSKEVITAYNFNEKIISIVGTPNLQDSERIKKIADLLNSEVETERKRGEKLLAVKDLEIITLQRENERLKLKYESQIDELLKKSKSVARGADSSLSTIDTMSGFMGLNAVFWGLKTFFMTSLTWVTIFVVLFVVLRILSRMHPIAAMAFSIFDLIGSGVISIFKYLTPKAFEMCHFVKSNYANDFKNTLTYIVNTVQEFKEKQKEMGKIYTLDDLLSRLNGDMDQKHKDIVDEILVEEKWRKK